MGTDPGHVIILNADLAGMLEMFCHAGKQILAQQSRIA
jgi:hypothetical protein